MLFNYFKTAWRNISRNKVHAFINLSGLSVGLACSLLILLWINDELGMDAFHANGDRLYKVYEREYYSQSTTGDYDTPGLLAQEIIRRIPEVEDAVPMTEGTSENTFQTNEKILKIRGMSAGPSLFKMFSFPLLEGKPGTALSSPFSLAISARTAANLFGSPRNALGKTMRMNDKKDYTVTAVFDDLPSSASRQFDYVRSWSAWQEENKWANDWGSSGPLTYLLIRPDANPASVDKKLTHFLDSYNKNQDPSYRVELGLQKMEDEYLHSRFVDGKMSGGRIEYVRLFSIIAAVIVLIACINFMNLSTARSVKRAREVGIRKVIGARRRALILQFIGESLLLTLVAVLAAILLTIFLLPAFSQLTAKQLAIPFSKPRFWCSLLLLTVVTGLIAGSYPALYLSSFRPVKVLKGALKIKGNAIGIRKGLVVFQFVLTIIFITCTVVVSRQIAFIQARNIGYDRDNLVSIPIEGRLGQNYEGWKKQLLDIPGILAVGRLSDNPTDFDSQTNGVDWDGRLPDTRISFEHQYAGYDLVDAMKLNMQEGRFFSKDFPSDTNGFVINETAAKRIGYRSAIGRRLEVNGHKATVIGVVKDFHFNSLHEQIHPLVFEFKERGDFGSALIRLQTGTTGQVLAAIGGLTRKINPKFPFTWSFSDQDYRQLYRDETVIGHLSNIFSALAIFISCLGLLGLVMFTAEQKTKEIGIRKVLGATVMNIVNLMSADLLKLVLLAAIIASPIAWWVMNRWLDDYAYKVTLHWWMPLVAGIAALLIALLTISVQTIRSALNNPVSSLKTE